MMRGWGKINMQFIFLLVCFSVRKSSLSKLFVILQVKKFLPLHLLEQNMTIFFKLPGNLVSSCFVELLPLVPAGWGTLLALQSVMFQPMGWRHGPHMRTGTPGMAPWDAQGCVRGTLQCEHHSWCSGLNQYPPPQGSSSHRALQPEPRGSNQGFCFPFVLLYPKWTARIENMS